jgi:Flp pilus assembly protein TadG
MALELAILTPLVIAMLLTVVALGRVAYARHLVAQSAAAGARAASLSTSPGAAATAGRGAATDALTEAGISCTGPVVDVDTSGFRAGGQVTATVHCTADLSAMTLLGIPGTVDLHASATSPIETHRDLSPGSGAGTP